jgi:hypothetical protein
MISALLMLMVVVVVVMMMLWSTSSRVLTPRRAQAKGRVLRRERRPQAGDIHHLGRGRAASQGVFRVSAASSLIRAWSLIPVSAQSTRNSRAKPKPPHSSRAQRPIPTLRTATSPSPPLPPRLEAVAPGVLDHHLAPPVHFGVQPVQPAHPDPSPAPDRPPLLPILRRPTSRLISRK